jgi:DNA-binding NtrC family response regulator
MTRPLLCLIEDDPIMGESLLDRFTLEGIPSHWFRSGKEAVAALERQDYTLVLSDIRLPDLDGVTLFREAIDRLRALPPWIFITGYGDIEQAVSLLKLGARDYITKPFDLDELLLKLRTLCAPCRREDPDVPLLGPSPAMTRISELLPRLAREARVVLLTGESGVGKEVIAQTLHRLTGRAPFVPVNCAAFTESLLEAELFGHEKGAFTGATRARRGVFEQAHGGTLFLDEIGDMPLAMQAKLLRVVQERQVVRVGGERPVAVDVLLVCATHRDLRRLVEQGAFREDLYYRINVVQLRIPPLRERREDILWLARRFLEDHAKSHGTPMKGLAGTAERVLLEHPWPGNVRELRHAIERACILSSGPLITAEDLLFESSTPQTQEALPPLEDYLRQCESDYLARVLREHDYQIGRTAAALGISRKTLWEKMKKLSLNGKAV